MANWSDVEVKEGDVFRQKGFVKMSPIIQGDFVTSVPFSVHFHEDFENLSVSII